MMEPPEASSVDALAGCLGHQFADPTLLREALTHPSVQLSDRGTARFGYERLEFLGDRVLGLLIAEWLIERFPAEPEGALARRHTALVRAETLGEIGLQIGLGRHLLMSQGESGAGGRDNSATLADACEAVIGALYLDGGIESARDFVRSRWAQVIDRDQRPPQDPKTALQEWAQARGLPLPRYDVVGRSGPDHQPQFEIRVVLPGYPPVAALGPSKRIAERAAAERLLSTLASG